jgi:ribonuclease/clavin/mitogillin
MDETHMRDRDAAHRGESTIDEIYRQVRQHASETGMVGPLSHAGESVPRPHVIAPGIASFAVRTPTLPPATHTSCYVIGDRELVLVDPASPYEDEQQALDRQLADWAAQGRVVVSIWLTHHHGDHVGDAQRLAERLGVPVAAHEATAERLEGRVRVDRTLRDGDVLHLAGEPRCALRAVYTPGHAPGHLCFLEEQSGALVAGDMVAGVGTILIEPSEGNMNAYLASLARMKALAPRLLLPAHGPVITSTVAKLDEYVAHRLWRERRVVEALERLGTATSTALVPLAYADVPRAIFPLAERSLIAHLVKLVEDGRAERTGDVWRLRSAA